MRTSQIILVAAAVLVLLLLGVQAVDPVLYTAKNLSTAAHTDPATIERRAPGNADALVPLMDDLLGETGTLALTIKLKDYESAERDLARYSDLSSRFDRLVVTLDVSGTDIGEFQQNNRQNQEALAALLNDTRRIDDLKRLEVEVLDGDQRMAVAYEGEALRQKMQEGFTSYAKREAATVRIAEHYEIDATPYRESIDHFAEITAGSREAGGGTPPRSPLGIAVVPAEGRYGETLSIAGTYTGGTPGTPVGIYVDSRSTGAATLGENGTYASPYRIGRILAGSHIAYAVAGPVYSSVAAFEVLPANTTITLALAEVNGTAVACTGNLTAEGRPVTSAPILIRVDGSTLVAGETDRGGAYRAEITLPAGEHTLRAEFHGAGYPLNASESETATVRVRGEGISPVPFIVVLAAAAASVRYIRSRRRPEETVPEPPAAGPKTPAPAPRITIAGLPLREAATVLFFALRSRLSLARTKTPRDCALLAPAHAGFFERYERIRYAGKTPTEEEIREMKEEATGGEDRAT